ncbi:MAG TPA: hypothetical protein VNQ77_13010 [Frankiaceae bacterium]|nr:hypothetical protein [Frankiaceae bacterium]
MNALRRLPWWAVGMLAAALAYAAFLGGLLVTHAVTDPACGLPGLEVLTTWATLIVHPWLGFFVAFVLARPDRTADAFLLDIVVGALALAVNLVGVGPAVSADPRCDGWGGIQIAGGLVITAVAAALLARPAAD